MRNDELYHYGVLGMKWGVRRYQNEDGSWTNRGKSRRRSSEGHRKKKLTAAQKEKLKRVAKGAAIGTAVVGGAVGAALLTRKFGPKVTKALRTGYVNKIKGPNILRSEAIERTRANHNLIDEMTKLKQQTSKGSSAWNEANNIIKKARKENLRLFETKTRTGAQDLSNIIRRTPNDLASVSPSRDPNKLREFVAKNADKIAGVGGAAGVGAGATFMNHLVDNVLDKPRDKRAAKRSGQKYIERNSNARYADYMFPNPNKKK